jgi:hypothetical protein
MEFFYSRSDIEQALADAFKKRYKRKDAALTGVLLARPEDKITQEQIIPHLEYWHYRSDYFTDFFCAGYVPMTEAPDANEVGISIEDRRWGFGRRTELASPSTRTEPVVIGS